MEKVVKKYPIVIASGYLTAFNNLPCYNLDNGQRVFRFGDMTVALRGKLHGKFANYLATENVRKYIPERLWPDLKNDRLAQGVTFADNNRQIIATYDATDFIDVCIAFITAEENGEKLSIPQQEIVDRAKAFILATAKIGITGLIDEATGYQYTRPSDELAMKMAFFLSEELRPWEKTFPDQFWKELGRLTNWTSLKKRPRYWGRLVNEFVYEALDTDIAKYLQQNKPPRITGKRYHQWLQEDRGIKALMEHIWTIIGLAKTCGNIDDLRFEINKHFSKDFFQDSLFPRREIGQANLVGDKKKFDKAVDRAIESDKN